MAEQNEARAPGPARGVVLRRRDIVVLAALLVVAGVVAALLIRSPTAVKAPGGASASQSSRYAGLTVSPVKPAPALVLRNYLGTPVNLASYRGKAVLVTFLYTHCPDVCPLITSMLHAAISEMPASERRELQIIAVSVDPRGDTPATVAEFLSEHEMVGRMQYLIGSQAQLGRVWAAWGVASQRDSNPELVAHSALIYGITDRLKIAVVYPANFGAHEVVHDVPVLAHA